MDNATLRAVVAAHASAAVAPSPKGATPAVAASAPLIGATAVAPAPLVSAPVLRMLALSNNPSLVGHYNFFVLSYGTFLLVAF